MTVAVGEQKLIAQNRKARHDYFIEDSLEAGLVLQGTEVKSLRLGRASITEAYAADQAGEIYLINAQIPIYEAASRQNHEPKRPRKLLLHARERNRLIGMVRRQGYTLVPLRLYFNARGVAKLELGVARGKQRIDKRQTEKNRDWQRQKSRLLRDRG